MSGPSPQTPEADAYHELLGGARGGKRERAAARERWFARLEIERKEEVLFELEVLLKGLACFTNPRNHAGPPRRVAVVGQDFREPLALARDGMARVSALARALLGERERSFVFHRYLEAVVPDDSARTELARGATQKDTPEAALFALRHAMTNLAEVTGAVARQPRVPFRLFYATLAMGQQALAGAPHFDPTASLEFRPEFDRVTHPSLLGVMRGVPGERARRLVAITFLSLFRMLRYLGLLEDVQSRDPRGALSHLVLSALRSDGRALTSYLGHRAGPLLADSFEADLFTLTAAQVSERYDALRAEAFGLVEIKAALGGVAANLRLELRRAFENDLPAPDAPVAALREAVPRVVGYLRPALQNAVLVLGKALGGKLAEGGVFDDAAARRALSERLRRDVWMFSQIVRAFSAKAKATPTVDDRWSGPSSLQFVRAFLGYFQKMGVPLLRAADYPRFDAFQESVAALEEPDLLDPTRLARAVTEATAFGEFLNGLFDRIGQREELAGVPFDRRAAAEALKLYLGE